MPPPACRTTDLAASLAPGGAGLGNVHALVYLRNTGRRACLLYGYPRLGLQDRRRRWQPSHVTRGSTYFRRDPGRHVVVLRPGERAVSDLAWTDNPGPGEPERGLCEPVSTWLVVTPPNETHYLLVRFGRRGTSVCAHGGLTVTALALVRS